MTAKWPGNAWTIAPLPTARMVGAGVEETEEETEEAEEAEPLDNSLEARLERAMAEPDHEREAIFRELKEFRRQKRLNAWFGRQEQARAAMRADMDSILRGVAERSKREITNGGAMAETASDGNSYEDGNGELPYFPPRQFSQEDRERANQNRTRYTRSQWGRALLDFAQGRLTMTKEQYQALIAYGRSKGWLRPPSKR